MYLLKECIKCTLRFVQNTRPSRLTGELNRTQQNLIFWYLIKGTMCLSFRIVVHFEVSSIILSVRVASRSTRIVETWLNVKKKNCRNMIKHLCAQALKSW